jgi:hypothetical protein
MPRGLAVAEFRRGGVQSGRYGSGDNVQPSGRLGLVEGGLSLIREEFGSQGLVVVDWQLKSDVAALMAAMGERRGDSAAGADGRNAGASGHWREYSYDIGASVGSPS